MDNLAKYFCHDCCNSYKFIRITLPIFVANHSLVKLQKMELFSGKYPAICTMLEKCQIEHRISLKCITKKVICSNNNNNNMEEIQRFYVSNCVYFENRYHHASFFESFWTISLVNKSRSPYRLFPYQDLVQSLRENHVLDEEFPLFIVKNVCRFLFFVFLLFLINYNLCFLVFGV